MRPVCRGLGHDVPPPPAWAGDGIPIGGRKALGRTWFAPSPLSSSDPSPQSRSSSSAGAVAEEDLTDGAVVRVGVGDEVVREGRCWPADSRRKSP